MNHEDKLLKYIEENSNIESVSLKVPIMIAMIEVIRRARFDNWRPDPKEIFDLEDAVNEYDNILERYLTL